MKTHTFRNSTGACRVLSGGGVAAVIYAGVKPDRVIIVAAYAADQIILRMEYQHKKIKVCELEALKDWPPESVKDLQRLVDRVELKMEIVKRRKHSPQKYGRCRHRVIAGIEKVNNVLRNSTEKIGRSSDKSLEKPGEKEFIKR